MEEAEDLLCEAGDIIDRKFAAQAPCFRYGASGDVEGFH